MRQTAGLAVLQSMVDDLADELQRSVIVDDPDVLLVCASRHFGDEDPVRVRAVLQRAVDPEVAAFVLSQHPGSWSSSGLLEASDPLELRARFCVPLREQGLLLGLLMVIDADRTLTREETALIEERAVPIAHRLHADHQAADADRARLERLLRDLLGDGAGTKGARAAACSDLVHEGLLREGAITVTVVEALDVDGLPCAANLLERAAMAAVSGASGENLVGTVDGEVVLVELRPGGPDLKDSRRRAVRIRDVVRQRLGATALVRVGAGGSVSGLADAWRSRRQAEVALRAGVRVPTLDGVGVWDALDELAVLAQVEAETIRGAPLFDPLQRLSAHDGSGRLRETLTTYLEHGGSIPRTADALHLHRTSLYYRLHQVTEVTGLDLDDGAVRFRLQLALRLEGLGTGLV